MNSAEGPRIGQKRTLVEGTNVDELNSPTYQMHDLHLRKFSKIPRLGYLKVLEDGNVTYQDQSILHC
jgi:hypothetical protein